MKGLVLLHGTETDDPKPAEAEAAILKACEAQNSEGYLVNSS